MRAQARSAHRRALAGRGLWRWASFRTIGMTSLPAHARAALVRRQWARIVLLVAGPGLVVFGIVAAILIVTREEPIQGPAGIAIIGLVGAGIGAIRYGFVELPRDIRALRSPGVLKPIHPVFAVRRERGILWLPHHVMHAWLVADGDGELAVPVPLPDARRCAPQTPGYVHGDLCKGSHVVLRFGNEVIWPNGPVERVPDDAAEPLHPLPAAATHRQDQPV